MAWISASQNGTSQSINYSWGAPESYTWIVVKVTQNGSNVDVFHNEANAGSSEIGLNWTAPSYGTYTFEIDIWVDGQQITDTSTVVMDEPSYTLRIKIVYDANGGSGAPASSTQTWYDQPSASAYKNATLSQNIPTKSGYTFVGWLIDGRVESAGATITLLATETAEYTAVAQWQQGGNAYIWDGAEWKPATPYIWDGSQWVQATANIWDGSAWQS